VTRGKLVHNSGKRGVDELGLARWFWMQFVGNSNKSTRIISDYAPHQPTGLESADSQHRRYYNSILRKSARRRACALLSVHGAALDIKI
jgi:hypothetical protein